MSTNTNDTNSTFPVVNQSVRCIHCGSDDLNINEDLVICNNCGNAAYVKAEESVYDDLFKKYNIQKRVTDETLDDTNGHIEIPAVATHEQITDLYKYGIDVIDLVNKEFINEARRKIYTGIIGTMITFAKMNDTITIDNISDIIDITNSDTILIADVLFTDNFLSALNKSDIQSVTQDSDTFLSYVIKLENGCTIYVDTFYSEPGILMINKKNIGFHIEIENTPDNIHYPDDDGNFVYTYNYRLKKDDNFVNKYHIINLR